MQLMNSVVVFVLLVDLQHKLLCNVAFRLPLDLCSGIANCRCLIFFE